jgi:uncharacterized protein with LGFP repeats
MTAGPDVRRSVRPLVAALAVLAALLIAPWAAGPPTGGTSELALALAADTSQFQAGNIISDDLFFDGGAMSAADVQAFLDTKGRSCTSRCLKDFRQDTVNKAADAYCRGYAGAPGETAAWIIAKVGQSCGISQRVLLVIMQKEQSLVTGNGTDTRYRSALGFGCPDTAACDTQYYGFFNQVYNAARQYQVYASNPTRYNFRAGVTRAVLYHPTAACGSGSVYIANQATAGLYNYTPYQPNARALAAGYGTGDSCSAYGNRNFWLYYTDWYGSTQSPGGNAVVARAAAVNGALGSATSAVVCGLRDGGCFQHFQTGSIYWSAGTGARVVKGAIRDQWAAQGWEGGRLGYPTGEEICGLRNAGCLQTFQGGSMYWSGSSGAHAVGGAIATAWGAQKWETGPLGYPTGNEVCGLRDGGCLQTFQGGSMYWSLASGAHSVSGEVFTKWGAAKWETGALGYPTKDSFCGLRSAGCFGEFQGGSVYWTSTTGAHVVSGAVLTKWAGLKWETSALGYPTEDTVCGLQDSGCFAEFQNGAIYSSVKSGTHVVSGAVRDRWAALQWETGTLGYPTKDTFCGLAAAGCFGEFQGGSVYWTAATGARVVSGKVLTKWAAQGWETGALGYPTADTVCGLVGGGCSGTFQGGTVYSSSAGTFVVSGQALTTWDVQGREAGSLGYPTRDAFCGLRSSGCFQDFTGGSVYWTPTTGAHVVSGTTRTAWGASGWELGALGYPTADQVCGLPGGGCSQQFQGGSVTGTPATGAHAVSGAIGTLWTTAGKESGALGYPTRDVFCGLTRSGCFQDFQNGSVYTTPTAGTHAVSGALRTYWGTQGWELGTLGYPTGDAVTTSGEITQRFEGGTVVQNRSTGVVSRR